MKKLIEERIRLKKDKQSLQEHILKIIANSTSYGIFIEINTTDRKEQTVDVYGNETFKTTAEKEEIPGKSFNPIMAVFLTASSRLILTTAESLVLKNDGYFAYCCDTDSIFISSEYAKQVQNFFRPLNPYSVDVEMFKVETDENGKLLDNTWFYGISAKRYVIYDYNQDTGKIVIRKYSSHGLGHLLNINEKQVWEDILTIHYHQEKEQEILKRYDYKYAISQLSISTPDVWKRFEKLNNGKPYDKQIKPFNFILVGTGYQEDMETKEPIIPMMPYISPNDRKFEEVSFRDFIDYKTGKQYSSFNSVDTQQYWKPLTTVLKDYTSHPESKSEGDIGILRRRHITIGNSSIEHIGKESNALEESQIFGVKDGNYTQYQNVKKVILNLNVKSAKAIGISKRNLYYLKEKAISGDLSKIKLSTINKLSH